MTTHTIIVTAWAGSYAASPEEMLQGKGLYSLAYYPEETKPSAILNYSKVGAASITVTLLNKEEMIDAKVAALEAELQKTFADAEFAATRIRSQIQSLLAITNEVSA